MALRQRKYSKGLLGRCTRRTLPPCSFRTTAFEARYSPVLLTFARTSDQFRSSWRPGPNHTPSMQIGQSIKRKGPGRGVPPLPAPNLRPFLLSKFILAPTVCSYLKITLFTTSMSKRWDTKTMIWLVYVQTFPHWSPTKGTPRRARFAPLSLCLQSRGSKARI